MLLAYRKNTRTDKIILKQMKYGGKPVRMPLSGEKKDSSYTEDIPYGAEREGGRETDK